MNRFMCKRLGIGQKEITENVPLGEFMKNRAKRVWRSFKHSFWALLSPVIILGGIYAGIFTPTEAACVSVVYSLIISMFVYRELTIRGLLKTLKQTAVLNGITSFLLGYATVFSTYLAFENIPRSIYDILMNVTDNKFAMLLLINLVLLVIGCFLDTVPAIVVMAPILLPAVVGYGVDPVHFGIIITINLGIGLCTPPYGCNLFVGVAVGHVKMERMMRYVIPFFILSVASLLVVTFVPQLSLLFL
jgi:C4-dicarboxylate transporter DctM subunit